MVTLTLFKSLTGTMTIGSERFPQTVFDGSFKPIDPTNESLLSVPPESITGKMHTSHGTLEKAPDASMRFESDYGRFQFEFTLDAYGCVIFRRWLS